MQLQLEGTDLDELLARVHRECGPNGRIVSAEKVRTGGIAGFFASERYEVVVEVEESLMPAASSDPAAGLDELLGNLADRVSAAEQALARRRAAVPKTTPPAAAAPPPPPSPAVPAVREEPAATVSTETPSFRSVMDSLVRSAGADVEPRPAPQPPAVDVPTGDSLAALVTSLRRLPDPPSAPTHPGTVLALVGDTTAALRTARDLATEMRLPADAVTVVSRGTLPEKLPGRLRANGPDTAAYRRVQWAQREFPTLVVVDAPVGLRGVEWARDVLAALDATTTWAVVEATRKPADVRLWTDALGRVDALAVDDLDSTTDPAAVLAVGLPVARLDGRVATRSAWAGLLASRLNPEGAGVPA